MWVTPSCASYYGAYDTLVEANDPNYLSIRLFPAGNISAYNMFWTIPKAVTVPVNPI